MDEAIVQILIGLAIKDGVYKEGDSVETIQRKLSRKRGQGHKQKYTKDNTAENLEIVSDRELLEINGMGMTTVNEIREKLDIWRSANKLADSH